ncbi:MAG TPA: hypothetical protein DCQ26_05475 [Marinilabiliales bacterium]|nr:MAG: hypothetical protein A2W84_16480 [Bacteroidetes bacterium GWC2_40_13]OFX73974.1 MAG: hypothetical protein A2W96_11705 [Bacteroidetes bacterium GWD2_40_43]OFX93192.1 MAG: hypothetical protein A2W97_06365 [Bacteroidetes bacterium GWE2_40_63]OFY21562.1 MAG: hypothetical protein A2W88_10365 [Bacteroidetes bacterium GWF2_40_13]HAM98040.1 hypothetical protein [Marinilabiliales bacterium]
MNNKILLVSVFLTIFIQGTLFSQKRLVPPHFNQIHLFGKIEVRLEPAAYDSVVIESGSFDVENVQVAVEGGILSVKLTSEFPSQIKVKTTIYYSELKHLEAGGGIKLYNKGAMQGSFVGIEAKSGSEFDLLIQLDSAQVLVNKGAFVRLTGTCPKVDLKTATGGDYRATALQNDTTFVKMNGGTAEVDVKLLLDADVRLGASLKYKTLPKKMKKTEKLGGTISQLEDF